jgi:condensin-2 complex subunit G2
VKRVYALRGALLLLDYDDEATDAFKTLLLQCFLKTTYLRSADGRRLLTYLFGLHPDLIPDIHATVKNQLPRVRRLDILLMSSNPRTAYV